jgi:hypothetical protein
MVPLFDSQVAMPPLACSYLEADVESERSGEFCSEATGEEVLTT